uniref:Uncharacterized protein n=1 Tax=Arundo donax TaxID=35708 RepID=A0A0A9CWX3_ARUDO
MFACRSLIARCAPRRIPSLLTNPLLLPIPLLAKTKKNPSFAPQITYLPRLIYPFSCCVLC